MLEPDKSYTVPRTTWPKTPSNKTPLNNPKDNSLFTPRHPPQIQEAWFRIFLRHDMFVVYCLLTQFTQKSAQKKCGSRELELRVRKCWTCKGGEVVKANREKPTALLRTASDSPNQQKPTCFSDIMQMTWQQGDVWQALETQLCNILHTFTN